MKNKIPFYSSLATLFFVSIWVVIMILDLSKEGSLDSFEKVYSYVSKLSLGFYITYVSATFFTLTNIVLFISLYQIFKEKYPVGSMIGVFFIPVYGALNILAYFSQVTIVPKLLDLGVSSKQMDAVQFALQQIIQLSPDSFIAFLNILAYALLAIPSIIFGFYFLKFDKLSKTAGFLILFSGVLSLTGFLGTIIGSSFLTKGVLFGGFIFWLALFPLTFLLFKKESII